MADELIAVTNVVGLVVLGGSENHQDAIGGKVVHLAPEAGAYEQAFRMGIQVDAFFASAVEQAHADGAGDADAKLMELFMRMEAAADARLGTMDPVDAADREWQCAPEFSDGELAAGIAALRYVDEMNQGRGHRPWVMIVFR
jgi:hypothetical protein